MIERLPQWKSKQPWVPVALIGAGVLIRLAWVATNTTASQMIGESNNVAMSFALNGTLADAFRTGQGPTAHIMPIMPIIAGTVYRMLGIQTASANLVLTLFAILLVVITWTSLYVSMSLVGMTRATRLCALAFLTLIPINVAIEAVEFRVWEGGLAVALASTLLWHVLRLDTLVNAPIGRYLLLGLHAAITLFVSPALGCAGFACGFLLMVRRSVPARWPAIVGTVFAVTVLVLTPWTLRNIAVMGHPIVLRDNFGLEFGQAFYAGAEVPGTPRAKFLKRHYSIHPYQMTGNAAMVASGGEVKYNNKLAAQASAWVRSHPEASCVIALRHLRDLLFPPAWYWSQFGRTGVATSAKLALNWVLSALALIGLVLNAARSRTRLIYVAAMIALPLIPYIFVEPTLRYRYLIINLLAFVAVDALSQLGTIILSHNKRFAER